MNTTAPMPDWLKLTNDDALLTPLEICKLFNYSLWQLNQLIYKGEFIQPHMRKAKTLGRKAARYWKARDIKQLFRSNIVKSTTVLDTVPFYLDYANGNLNYVQIINSCRRITPFTSSTSRDVISFSLLREELGTEKTLDQLLEAELILKPDFYKDNVRNEKEYFWTGQTFIDSVKLYIEKTSKVEQTKREYSLPVEVSAIKQCPIDYNLKNVVTKIRALAESIDVDLTLVLELGNITDLPDLKWLDSVPTRCYTDTNTYYSEQDISTVQNLNIPFYHLIDSGLIELPDRKELKHLTNGSLADKYFFYWEKEKFLQICNDESLQTIDYEELNSIVKQRDELRSFSIDEKLKCKNEQDVNGVNVQQDNIQLNVIFDALSVMDKLAKVGNLKLKVNVTI